MKNKISYKRKVNSISEGEAMASPGISSGGAEGNVPFQDCPGIDTVKVLGKFDPKKGCMGDGDFHLPKRIMPVLYRWPMRPTNYKKKKRKSKKFKYFNNLMEDDSRKVTMVYNLPINKVEEILDSSDITNKRYNRAQFTKYIGPNKDYDAFNVEFVGLFSNFPKKCLAMAVLGFDIADDFDCYIYEIQSFQKGCGKQLLLNLLKHQKKLWLMADVTADKRLLDFYRDPVFHLKEYTLPDSTYGCPATFFYTKDCNEDNIRQYIEEQFKKED